MGNCKYCGEPAGLLKSEHPECRKFVNDTVNYIADVVLHLFRTGDDPQPLISEVASAASRAKLGDSGRMNAMADGFEKAIDDALDDALDDGILTEDEEERLTTLADRLDLEPLLGTRPQIRQLLVKAAVLRDVMSGQIRSRLQFEGLLPFMLAKNEVPLWAFQDVDYFETKTRRHYEGGSAGVSVRIMKGVYYRTSAFKGYPVSYEETERTDRGMLLITDRNLFFDGNRNFKIPLKRLISVERLSDGIQVQKDGVRAKPQGFAPLDGWFAYNLIMNLRPD